MFTWKNLCDMSIELVDTHCHLYLEQFNNDIDTVIHQSIERGIKNMFLPNIDVDSVKGINELSKKYPDNLFSMTGLHPTSVTVNWRSDLETIFNNVNNPKAVGEIGIDLYWDKTFFAEQQDAFIAQIDYSIQQHLPIVIHSRNSLDIIIEMLKPYKGKLQGVFHCYPGNEIQAKKVIDMGFYLGIGGVVTYKNSAMAKVAELIPLEWIVLETDAPFLPPVPYRGQRNSSEYIREIAEFIVNIRGISIEELALATTRNAKKLFNF